MLDAHASPYIYAAPHIYATPYVHAETHIDTEANKHANSCDRSADTIHTNRSTLPPGWTRGDCYAEGGTWTPTPKPTATNTPTDPPTSTPTYTPTPTEEEEEDGGGGTRPTKTPTPAGPTPTPCSTGGSSAKDSKSTSPCPTPRPIPTPTPTPVPFSAKLILNPQANASPRMDLLSVAIARLTITPAVDTFIVERYDFRLVLTDTGLYSYDPGNQKQSCYPSIGKTVTAWKVSTSTAGFLARCGLGSATNQGILVQARLEEDHSQILEARVYDFYPLAVHRDPPQIFYEFDLSSIEGTRPNFVDADPDNEFYSDFREATKRGANMWNLGMGNRQIFRPGPPSNMTIKVSWYGAYELCEGRAVLGCASTHYSDSHATTDTTVRIPYPPAGEYGTGVETEWTNDFGRATEEDTLGQYFYLPGVMAHELAHGLGVGDTTYGLMGPYDRESPMSVPFANDRHGMEEVISSHTHGGGGNND